MYKLTQQEQLAIMIGIFSIILIIVISLFSSDYSIYFLIFGGITVLTSLILAYVFIFQPMKGKVKPSPFNQFYTSQSSSFRPTIIPPSKMVKKTVMKGSCEYCGKRELMGFTCSYCDSYFCAEHRLPEKHDCIGIKR
ncbi:MAG: AN1-type zinc finger domain-containing protein [Promethearchaeota archaeon]